MPKMKFKGDHKISETWFYSLDIPQEIVDEGEQAMVAYVRDQRGHEECLGMEEDSTYVDETCLNVHAFEELE